MSTAMENPQVENDPQNEVDEVVDNALDRDEQTEGSATEEATPEAEEDLAEEEAVDRLDQKVIETERELCDCELRIKDLRENLKVGTKLRDQLVERLSVLSNQDQILVNQIGSPPEEITLDEEKIPARIRLLVDLSDALPPDQKEFAKGTVHDCVIMDGDQVSLVDRDGDPVTLRDEEFEIVNYLCEMWKFVTTESLGLSSKIVNALADNPEMTIKTMGDIAAWTQSKLLIWIPKIGDAAVEAIENATLDFWENYQQPILEEVEK